MLYKFKVLLFFYYISNYLLLKPTQPREGKVTLAITGHLRFRRITDPLEAKQERKEVDWVPYIVHKISPLCLTHNLPSSHSQDAQDKSVLDPR